MFRGVRAYGGIPGSRYPALKAVIIQGWGGAGGSSPGLPDDPTADDRGQNLDVADGARVDGEDVGAQDDHVGEPPGRDRPLLVLLELGVGRAGRVGHHRVPNAYLLLRHPALRVFAVERGA